MKQENPILIFVCAVAIILLILAYFLIPVARSENLLVPRLSETITGAIGGNVYGCTVSELTNNKAGFWGNYSEACFSRAVDTSEPVYSGSKIQLQWGLGLRAYYNSAPKRLEVVSGRGFCGYRQITDVYLLNNQIGGLEKVGSITSDGCSIQTISMPLKAEHLSANEVVFVLSCKIGEKGCFWRNVLAYG